MKVLKVIEKVRKFNFFNNELIIEKTNDIIYKGQDFFKFRGESDFILEDNCICDILQDYADVYNLNFDHLVRIKRRNITSVSIIKNNIYSVRWEDKSENDYSSIYENEKEIKVRNHFYGRYFKGKYRIIFNGFNRKEIFFYNHILTDIFLWHYSLPEGFKIFGSVEMIDDVLFFSCVDANLRNSKLIGLEIETGKILWEFENLVDFQVDFKHKLLRGYGGAYYQVIDPFKGKILVNKDLKEFWDKGIDPTASNNTITDDRLWFVSGRGENTKFGAIDLETSEIDFIQDFPLENDGQLDKPVFHQNKLYLRDTNNVLYVLE